jgi:hypothetical protein
MAIKLTTAKLFHKSGLTITPRHIKTIKKNEYYSLNESVGGDAPKDVIKLYEYGRTKKDNLKSWIRYIAKIGHKWYPNESITEQLLTEIGKCFGIKIANSKLVYAENYIRFLSEHFHNEEQTLIHGANILSRFIKESDNSWIDDMDRNRTLKSEININDVIRAIENVFPDDFIAIINDFYHMILFDALTGNNDRHYYNWGVVTHIKNKHKPYFSPVYDTARALFWNESDNYIVSLQKEINNPNNLKINNYVIKSVPKLSVPNNKHCNHFDLVNFLKEKNYISDEHKYIWTNEKNLEKVISVLNKDFKYLFIPERRVIIEKILRQRFNNLVQILTN